MIADTLHFFARVLNFTTTSKIFNIKDGDKNKNNKLNPLRAQKYYIMLGNIIKLLEKYKTICSKIEDLKYIELDVL